MEVNSQKPKKPPNLYHLSAPFQVDDVVSVANCSPWSSKTRIQLPPKEVGGPSCVINWHDRAQCAGLTCIN